MQQRVCRTYRTICIVCMYCYKKSGGERTKTEKKRKVGAVQPLVLLADVAF